MENELQLLKYFIALILFKAAMVGCFTTPTMQNGKKQSIRKKLKQR